MTPLKHAFGDFSSLLVQQIRDYAIYVLDARGCVATWNLGAERITGYTEGEILGKHLSTFHSKDDIARRKPWRMLEIAAAEGQFKEEGWRTRKEGTRYWADIVITALRNNDDQLTGYTCVTRDITEKRKVEEALHYRLSMEELVTRISTQFAGIPAEEMDIQIQQAIREVAEFANADRIRVVLLSESGDKFIKVYEWFSGTSKDLKHEIEGQPVKIVPWLFSRLKAGETVVVPLVDELPKEASAEKNLWRNLSVKSFVAIPLISGKTFLGYLGFDGQYPGRNWKEEDIRLLRLVGEILVNVLHLQEAEEEKRLLRAQLKKQYSLKNIIGKHGKMEELFRLVHKVAPANTTVMLYGESGVGKELIAKAIHQLSPRAVLPMYAVNCAAIPENLLESELFGYERGAFTGAYARKKGILEEASGSTLFLDEIGDLGLPLQAKILRVLQEREIQRLGGVNRIPVDVRIISATHRDLAQMMSEGRFREDLYYRLNTFPLIIPPLRERITDIPLLVDHFLKKHGDANHSRAKKISPQALELLLSYPWPGNVRQLESVIERAVILAEGDIIHETDLPLEVRHTSVSPRSGSIIDLPEEGLNLEELEKYLLARALEKSGGVIAKAARLLGLTYRTLQYRMSKYGLTDYTKS
ncbi:MAG: sigma 54-interacting transcriptional regulator [Syntrophaceae bacterium]|nr:sigma 54-interacting transcriptional regulator [Syntrophaceae bacterium]